MPLVQVVDAVRLAEGVHDENEWTNGILGVHHGLRVLQQAAITKDSSAWYLLRIRD